jgi:putative ribose phosphate pyrophosphokinase
MTKELKMNAIPMTEDAASTVQATNKLEYVNLMEYLPLRYPPTLEEEKNRRIVSNFKRGRCSPELKNQFTDAIKQLKEERKDVKLRVCFIPAITADKTALRYSQLATAIESETGIPSDYHTILPKRATELMATGKTDPAEDFLINKEQIEGKDIILIGDIITTGTNFTKTCQKLAELGAKSVIGLFLAKTIHRK